MIINDLSKKDKVGQKFIVGINSCNIDDIIYLIKNYHIGGVLLYKKNYRNYNEMLSIIKRLKEANKNNRIPLFITIDQEGGVVNRLPDDINNLKNIYDISRTSKELVIESSKITSSILKDSGINMNLGPVLDIYNNSKSRVLYKRCFYGNSLDVCNNSKLYMKEFNKNNVIVVGKHFPGHGITKFDSHFFIPYVFNYKKILNKHILPFIAAINENIDVIMLGHLVIRKLTGILPASISKKFINKYLRNKYNYDGVVMTDEINMLSRRILYRFSYINKAINSGSDVILMKIKNRNDAIKVIKKTINTINSDKLDRSVSRIIKLKEKYKINDKIDFDGCNIEEINKKINIINSQVKNDIND